MLDWDDLRYFLAVARHGTLSGAARALEVTQPTVGRRIDAFERRLGARLFQRRPSGFALSAVGETIRDRVERMEAEAIGAERLASGRDDGLRGAVRITTTEWVAARVLGGALAALLERNPGLSVDVVVDSRHLNLARREADLAIRLTSFVHQAVYQRRLARVAFGIYAAPSYLARRGAPDFTSHAADHAVIAMADHVGDPARAWLAAHARRAVIVVRTDGREHMAALAAAGIGLACLPRLVGDATPGLRLLAPPVPIPSRTLWLGVHRDVRALPRVRAAIAALASELPQITALDPAAPRR